MSSNMLTAGMELDSRTQNHKSFLMPVLMCIKDFKEDLPHCGLSKWCLVQSRVLMSSRQRMAVLSADYGRAPPMTDGNVHIVHLLGILLASAVVVSSMSVVGHGGYLYGSCVVSAALLSFEWRPGRQ